MVYRHCLTAFLIAPHGVIWIYYILKTMGYSFSKASGIYCALFFSYLSKTKNNARGNDHEHDYHRVHFGQ